MGGGDGARALSKRVGGVIIDTHVDTYHMCELIAACTKTTYVKGWATKEQCRRAGTTHPQDVVTVLRACFDTKPRMNNYEIREELVKRFSIGPKVLRIAQISGWITSEIGRRKKAALHLVASAENNAILNNASSSETDIDVAASTAMATARKKDQSLKKPRKTASAKAKRNDRGDAGGDSENGKDSEQQGEGEGEQHSDSEVEDDPDMEELEVAEVVEKRMSHGGLEYLVAWVGYGEDDMTWEPAENLRDAAAAVARFNARPKTAPVGSVQDRNKRKRDAKVGIRMCGQDVMADPENTDIPNWMSCGHPYIDKSVALKMSGATWSGVVTAYAFSSQKGRSTDAVVWRVDEKGEGDNEANLNEGHT